MNKKVTNPRQVALDILQDVFYQGAYSNLSLHKFLGSSNLSTEDRSFVTELVYGTVARKMTLEWYLAHYIEDRDKLEAWVYTLLLLSLYQLEYLDKIPAHAVVYEAVEIAKSRSKKGADRLVNAVLRKIQSQGLPDISSIKRVNKRLSIQYSTPVWLVKELIEQFGQERAELILESLFLRSKVSMRVVHPQDREVLAEELDADFSLLSYVGLLKSKGQVASHPRFLLGDLTLQDETSQMVAPTLNLQGDERVLDACAAPGGKTCHIASYLKEGVVTALDLYDHKLRLIEENAERLGVADRVQTQRVDARLVADHFGPDSFDKILVDAPCSGIGLIRRKPDIKYNKENGDFAALQAIQLEILDSVCQTLIKGGIITYSTCTIFEQENFEVVKAFLESHPNFEQVPLTHPEKAIVVDGCLLVTPELYSSDGFFISQFRRVR